MSFVCVGYGAFGGIKLPDCPCPCGSSSTACGGCGHYVHFREADMPGTSWVTVTKASKGQGVDYAAGYGL